MTETRIIRTKRGQIEVSNGFHTIVAAYDKNLIGGVLLPDGTVRLLNSQQTRVEIVK